MFHFKCQIAYEKSNGAMFFFPRRKLFFFLVLLNIKIFSVDEFVPKNYLNRMITSFWFSVRNSLNFYHLYLSAWFRLNINLNRFNPLESSFFYCPENIKYLFQIELNKKKQRKSNRKMLNFSSAFRKIKIQFRKVKYRHKIWVIN